MLILKVVFSEASYSPAIIGKPEPYGVRRDDNSVCLDQTAPIVSAWPKNLLESMKPIS
ncbi:protein of unknown function [Georgfuchsia toluolica]|uniref:Uncharacterized protein n=1 Tax=Georgfuchsia toluolica TaxID=424218 RepID=A0A916J6G7_9PROT|nr:protein of unknown function [Georgfuchsia toluolica]